jgi:prepilin-type N-terminal cleavage/methylation domain-containing protein
MRNFRVKPTGFTLIEVLIATSIFTVVSLLAMTAYINITRIQSRINLENAIYEDGRFMMDRLTRDVRENAVDYEEYFNKNFHAASGQAWPYGHTYGCYSLQFYNPGINSSRAVDSHGLGALCGFPVDGDPAANPGCTIFKPSFDINTGKNPFVGRAGTPAETEASAFCASNFTYVLKSYSNLIKTCSPGQEFYPQQELYLIDKNGKKKTIFARRKIATSPDVYALGMVQLNGEDSDSDGIFDKWENCSGGANKFCCASGFDCTLTNGSDSLETTLATYTLPTQLYKGFIPVSPLRSTITRLNFIITPIEDPHKAFAEFSELAQPKVTIAMTLEPSPDQLKNFGGDPANPPEITLQTTVSSRVQTEVTSLPQTLPADCDY